MDIKKERFVKQMSLIVGSTDQEKEIFERMFDRFEQFTEAGEFLNAMDYVLSHNIPHDKKTCIIDPWVSNEEFMLITDSIFYVSKGKPMECENSYHSCTEGRFRSMLKKLNLSDSSMDEFIYKGNIYPKDNITRYRINVLNEPKKTLECLDYCIRTITARRKLSYDECKSCCQLLIDMIPLNRLKLDKWRDCRYEICKGISELYAKSVGGKIDDYLRKSCAVVCGASYWEQLYDIEAFYNSDDAEIFNEHLKVCINRSFIDCLQSCLKDAYETCKKVYGAVDDE